jgi:hypothetical protein
MGLAINWTVRSPDSSSVESVTGRVRAWREACLDLPFDQVTELVCFDAAEIARRLADRADEWRWLLVQDGASVAIDPVNPDEGSVSVDPIAVVGFTAYAGEECEPMNCFLARYPEQARVGPNLVRPGIKGWRGSSFAKTQYASTVAAQHFLKCHLTITAALDAAKAAGLLDSVLDEGCFWDDRNVEKLLTTVGRWNAMMAAFVGGLDLATGEGLAAPIKLHPEFERLEHFGTTGDTAAMAKAIAEALKHIEPEK